ncbi:AraC family transcriptional regulator [Roseococcus pinisoli]|uniref:AraC family transcriptional regulator n=1 Tax=Roseococcus pinisoli TaxID=2835040 RepID=A0ABS5Q8V2_9PROT|nr:AraC family transcriptional regulator [Roseococcus pinisoli]MBS7809919.1 AraC family transcriptional regulator [Roseococcus pinisoli]
MPIKTTTLTDHAARISRVVGHLSERLDRTPSLEELAGVAAFSPCHFHRVYRAMMGETPAETLTRLRLSRAAAALLRTGHPMGRIAREAGYGSVAAFTRAFREAHGLPPGAYRQRAGIGAVQEHDMTDVTFTDLPAMHLATLAHRGAYTEIGGAFERLAAWAGGQGLIGPETKFYGLYWDDPHTVPAEQLRSRAALTVPAGTPLGEGVEALSLPPLRCARLRFQGPYSELEGAYDRLYGEWLPASGEEPADQPALEHYLNDCRSLPPAEWLTDILLPLKPR